MKKNRFIILLLILIILILSACSNERAFGKIVNYKFVKSYGMNFRNMSTKKIIETPISIDILIPNLFLENNVEDSENIRDYIYINDESKENFRMLITGLYEVDETFPNNEEIWLKHKGHIYEVQTIDEVLKYNEVTKGINDNNYDYVMYASHTDNIYFIDIYLKIDEKYYVEIYLQLNSENKEIIKRIINSVKKIEM